MVVQTAESWINNKVQVKIYYTFIFQRRTDYYNWYKTTGK